MTSPPQPTDVRPSPKIREGLLHSHSSLMSDDVLLFPLLHLFLNYYYYYTIVIVFFMY